MRPLERTVRIASTIGPVESGLIPVLEDRFTVLTGVPVECSALGSGAALELALTGTIDLVITHAPALEIRFVADGFAVARSPFMASTFVLAGPPDDPAGVRGLTDVLSALALISESGVPFLSRGDRSGTHLKELELWSSSGIDPVGEWYRTSAHGALGSAAVAREAARTGAYTLIDWTNLLSSWPALVPLATSDPKLINIFSALPVNPDRVSGPRSDLADLFLVWLLSPEAQALIGEYGRAEYGEPLFLPLAQLPGS